MKYQNLIIYYFSGTGNARNAAIKMTERAAELGVNTLVFDIDKIEKLEIPILPGKTLIGFCSPTHGFNLPPVMLKFIAKFPENKNKADVFILNTRAGMKFLKIFLPGLSGVAQYFPAAILRIKGYKIVGQQPLDMPSNWISLHPGLRQKVSESVQDRCERISIKVIECLLTGEKIRKAWLSLPFDLAISPVSIGYYFFGRFMIAKTFVATNKCTLCGLCQKQCPVNAIIQVDNRMFWKHTCESCMRCMNNCPEKAIETAHGFVAATIIAISFSFALLSTFFFNDLKIFPGKNQYFAAFWDYLVSPAFSILIFIIFYRISHFLMRFRVFKFFVEYTSLTKIPFWRRYKARKIIHSKQKLDL